MPDEMEYYTHRSGRTARAGKKGISVALVSRGELFKVKQIEKTLKTSMKRMMVPTGPEVCQKQLLNLMHKVREVKVNEAEMGAFLPAVMEELHDLTKQDLIARFASIEFNRFLDYYRNAPDLNVDGRKAEGQSERYAGGARFFINLGKMDGLDKSGMLEVLDDYAGLEKKDIGKIDIKGAYSFFEVEKHFAEKVIKGFNAVEYQGRPVRVEMTEVHGSGSSERRERPSRSGGKSYSGGRSFEKKKYSDRKGDRKGGFRKKW